MESLEQVKVLVEKKLDENDYNLHSFKFTRGKNATLEIIVDRDAPIGFDDISIISNIISELLDMHDFTDSAYMLDISSLGAEKPIDVTKLEKYKDQYINIHLTHPYKGESYLEGNLVDVNDSTIKLFYFKKGKKTTSEIERKYIDKARLAIKF